MRTGILKHIHPGPSLRTAAAPHLILLQLLFFGCGVEDDNLEPIADAGVDQVLSVTRDLAPYGQITEQFQDVTLNGSGSYDPDGAIVRYYWSIEYLPVGSQLTFDSLSPNQSDEARTTFLPDAVGAYGFSLIVFDGQRLSEADFVQIDVLHENAAPEADAGEEQYGYLGTASTFDASASRDPDGDYLSYRWSLEVKPSASQLSSASLIYPATPNPRLTPDAEGVYTLSLVVSDGMLVSEKDFVTLTATTLNHSPVVDPGAGRTVNPCHPTPLLLDGSSSYDPDGDDFSYEWSVAEKPTYSLVTQESLSSPSASTTEVTLDVYGLYVFLLTLDDGISGPSSASVAIYNDDGSTQEAPIADAGASLSARAETSCTDGTCEPCALSVQVDGSASWDPNDDPLTFAWEVVSGSATIEDPSLSVIDLLGPSLTPSEAGRTVSTTVELRLIVSDCESESEPAETSITFVCEGR